MIDKILYELSGLFSSLNADRAIDVYKLREEIDRLNSVIDRYIIGGVELSMKKEIDRLHATLNEYRESEIVLRARIEELEEMLDGKE